MSWLVWKITASPVWLGVIGFTIQFPMLVLGLPGGVFADRYDRLGSLKILQTLCMIQAMVLAIITIGGYVELWHVILLGIGLGSIYAFEFPIRQAFVTDMVGKRDLLNAVSLISAMLHATRVAGPMAAGWIVAWKGEGACFLFNALTFIALITALFLIDKRALIRVKVDDQSFINSALEGLRHLWGDRHLKLALILMCIVSLIGMPVVYLMPIFADEIFMGGAMQLGWLMAASATGSLMGAIFLANRRSSEGLLTMASRSLILNGTALVGFGIAPNIWFAMAAIVFYGFFMTITISSCITLLQHFAPDHLRGRMMSFFTTTFMGFAPFGSLLGGFLAKTIGAPKTIDICGVACFLASLLILRRAKHLDNKGFSVSPR